MTRLRFMVAASVVILSGAIPAMSQLAQIYAASESFKELVQYDYATGKETILYDTVGEPDDLIVNSAGQLIYSVPTQGTVNLWDPGTGINTVLTYLDGARDLIITPDGQNLMIARIDDPPSIWEYNFASGSTSVFFPKTKGITSMDGLAFDPYGNFYAVASKNTIIQLNPQTGAIINTLVIEPHNGVNGADGLTYDSYSNSLWATHLGKVWGGGLLQFPVQPSGFASTSPGFTFYPLPTVGAPDGIKSDGQGNLYIGAIHTAPVFNIPTQTLVTNPTVKGSDGVALVPGSYPVSIARKHPHPQPLADGVRE
jgi:WD40 repeat protein